MIIKHKIQLLKLRIMSFEVVRSQQFLQAETGPFKELIGQGS